MLKLDEFYVFGFMGSAIFIATIGLGILESRNTKTRFGGMIALQRSDVKANHLKGGAIFGCGWAIAGTCPAPVIVMLTSGVFLSLIVIAGILSACLANKQVAGFGDGEHRLTNQVGKRA